MELVLIWALGILAVLGFCVVSYTFGFANGIDACIDAFEIAYQHAIEELEENHYEEETE